MTLRLHIHLIVGALTLLFITAVMWLEASAMRKSVNEEVVAANRVAAQLLQRTAGLQETQGTPAMLHFLQGMGRVRSNDIVLIDGSGRELYRSPPSTYKAGRDAPAWFARLIAPPPSSRTISLAGGRLVVQSNASRAVLDAWDSLTTQLGAGLLLLLLVNALVFWRVGRTVRPFRQIVDALGRVQAGQLDVRLPPLAGREAAEMGVAFNRMVLDLRDHIETERRAVRAELALSDSRELTRWIDHHIEQERRLIARELHDELGQSVTAMRSMALSIAQRIHGLDAQSEAAARLIADESSRLYDAMHGIIPRLTPLVLDNFGLADALHDLAERTRRSQPGVVLELEVDLGEASLGADAALMLYRAAQEGISNALRHGRARHLHLRVQAGPEAVTLTLRDDGSGLPAGWAQRAGHHGLRWMTERAEGVGGTLRIGAAQPQGVELHVRLPLQRTEHGTAEAAA